MQLCRCGGGAATLAVKAEGFAEYVSGELLVSARL